jgi:hypothetical protein
MCNTFLGQLNISDQFSFDSFACVAYIFAFEAANAHDPYGDEALIATLKNNVCISKQ